MTEQWKVIDGYDRYQVSNYGQVKSFAKNNTGKLLTLSTDHKGYNVVTLYDNNGNRKTIKVHRLVAMAFLFNPENLPEVNHKDENKLNNHVNNLEWCSTHYNNLYGTRIERAAASNQCCPTTSKKIYSIDINNQIEYFDSIGEAARRTGLNHANIIRALKGKCKTCGRRKWYYQTHTNYQQRLNEKDFVA